MGAYESETNTMAIVSAVLGGVSWVLGGLASCALLFVFPPLVFCGLGLFFGGNLGAAITGYLGREQIKASGGTQGGDSLAMTGLVLGGVGLGGVVLLPVIGICVVVVLALAGPAVGNVFSNIIIGI